MALQLAWDVATQDIPTLFLSLEMYEEDVIERLFVLSQKVDNYELLSGKFKHYQERWTKFEETINKVPLIITDMLGKSFEEVDVYLRSLSVKPKLVIIDHLQEARNAGLRNQKDVIDEYLKQMRILAIRDNFSLVICSQVNRQSQEEKVGTEPQLHNLKSSGYIEEGADIIILLHWPWHYKKTGDKSKFILNVAKNRNGRTGWIDVCYKPEFYWFYELTKPDEEGGRDD